MTGNALNLATDEVENAQERETARAYKQKNTLARYS